MLDASRASAEVIDLRNVLPPPQFLLAFVVTLIAVSVFPFPRWRHYVAAWLAVVATYLVLMAFS